MEYVLTTDHLCKNYGHFKALNQCSMHVPRGAISVSYTHLTLPTTSRV